MIIIQYQIRMHIVVGELTLPLAISIENRILSSVYWCFRLTVYRPKPIAVVLLWVKGDRSGDLSSLTLG